MPAALVSLVLALAAPGAPAIVLTPATEAPSPVLSTRCARPSPTAAGNDIDCVVEEARRTGPATVMRISIRGPKGAPCAAADATSVAIPAADGPAKPRALPVVVQEPRQPRCDR